MLPGIVNQVLGEAGAAPQDINIVAVSIGPGSFTGLRVGLSFAKGFAQGCGAAVVPVGTLDSLALRMYDFLDKVNPAYASSCRLCPLTVARRGEVFGRIFRISEDSVVPVDEPFLSGSGQLTELLEDNFCIAGEGADNLKGELLEQLGDRIIALSDVTEDLSPDEKHILYIPELGASAVTVGRTGMRIWRAGQETVPLIREIEPLYLKEFTVKYSPVDIVN